MLYVTDYSSRIPVLIRPSGRRAILSGDGARAPRLDFLEDPEGVRPGDRIVTSGDGQVFPPDLAVGIAVVGPDGTPRARLAADLERLEFVRILRYRPDTTIDRPGGLIRNGPLPDAAPLDGEAGEAVDGEESGAAGDAGGPSPEASDGGAQSPVAAATR